MANSKFPVQQEMGAFEEHNTPTHSFSLDLWQQLQHFYGINPSINQYPPVFVPNLDIQPLQVTPLAELISDSQQSAKTSCSFLRQTEDSDKLSEEFKSVRLFKEPAPALEENGLKDNGVKVAPTRKQKVEKERKLKRVYCYLCQKWCETNQLRTCCSTGRKVCNACGIRQTKTCKSFEDDQEEIKKYKAECNELSEKNPEPEIHLVKQKRGSQSQEAQARP